MQKGKIKVFLASAAAALLIGACGSGQPAPASGTGKPAGGPEAGEGGSGSGGGNLTCESSDDCQDGLICVDEECMIPKLAR